MTRVVVFDAERDLYLGTNNSGSVLWKALAAGATRSQLVGLLVERFDIEQDRVMSPIAVFAVVMVGSRSAWWVGVFAVNAFHRAGLTVPVSAPFV